MSCLHHRPKYLSLWGLAHEIVMDIFEPDPDDPQKEVKAEWYWERISKSEAIVLTRLADLIRRSR
jgi:hypothetical protein